MIPPVKLRDNDNSPHQLVFVNLILICEMGINFICCYFNLSCIFTRVEKAFKCITANILTAIYKPWKASFCLLKQWPSPSLRQWWRPSRQAEVNTGTHSGIAIQ